MGPDELFAVITEFYEINVGMKIQVQTEIIIFMTFFVVGLLFCAFIAGFLVGRPVQRRVDVTEFLYYSGLRASQANQNDELANHNFSHVIISYLEEINAKPWVPHPFSFKTPITLSEKGREFVAGGLEKEAQRNRDIEQPPSKSTFSVALYKMMPDKKWVENNNP